MYGGIRSTHLVCTGCRVSMKRALGHGNPARPCPVCRRPMRDAGPNLAVPRRADLSGWRALATVLDSGFTYHSRCDCCQDGPGHRPHAFGGPSGARRWAATAVAASRNPPGASKPRSGRARPS
ncbi:hypothetical protein [Nocardia sp. NBC_01388]|uniref:hypothetical protein n=1 Tax=Nocardia sp. NBC_01388 TaxID=2903596 RepID=UPI00324D6E33